LREPILTQEVYLLLNELIAGRYGIEFPEHRKEILEARLRPRVETLHLPGFWDYYLHLCAETNGEHQRLAELVTNNETFFFRETQQLECFLTEVAPRLKPAGRLRVLCAGCSSGEEPFTLGILAKPGAQEAVALEIDAFDIDAVRIAAARRGEYGRNALRLLSPEQLEIYFQVTSFQANEPERWTLRPEYRTDVRFAWGNIVEPSTFAGGGLYDAVFCRNVFIYFSAAALLRAVASFAAVLRPGGLLFLGASESIIGLSDRFETVRLPATIAYRKASP